MSDSINKDRIEHIARMEKILDQSSAAVAGVFEAMQAYRAILPELKELSDYYTSPQWLADFEADEAGLMPEGLKRGVLSEDAVCSLLDYEQLLREEFKRFGR